MRSPSFLLLSAVVAAGLSSTAHAQSLLITDTTVGFLTEPMSVPLGIIGGLGAFLLLRPRGRRRR